MKVLALLLLLYAPALADSKVRYVELEDCHWSFVQEGPRYYKVSTTDKFHSRKAVEDVFTDEIYFVLDTAVNPDDKSFLYFDRFECNLVQD